MSPIRRALLLIPLALSFAGEILAPESGCFRAVVRAEGYLPMEIPLVPLVEDVELPAAHLLPLSPSAVLSGIVVDGSGQPIKGAVVEIGYMKGRQSVHLTDWSRADGGFRFAGLLPGGTFDLAATHSGFARTTASARTAPACRPSPLVRIVMTDGQAAFGRVVDGGGRPVAGADVVLITRSQESYKAGSDDAGRFEFRHLSPGTVSLRATHPGHAPGFLEDVEIPPRTPDFDLGTVKLPAGEAPRRAGDGQPRRAHRRRRNFGLLGGARRINGAP